MEMMYVCLASYYHYTQLNKNCLFNFLFVLRW
jgi:hypothetical protein